MISYARQKLFVMGYKTILGGFPTSVAKKEKIFKSFLEAFIIIFNSILFLLLQVNLTEHDFVFNEP
jgi:hypothetical protein